MKIYVVIEGEFNQGSFVKGVFSTFDKAMIQVDLCKKEYFDKNANWVKREFNEWVNSIDYIKIDEYGLDEFYSDSIITSPDVL